MVAKKCFELQKDNKLRLFKTDGVKLFETAHCHRRCFKEGLFFLCAHEQTSWRRKVRSPRVSTCPPPCSPRPFRPWTRPSSSAGSASTALPRPTRSSSTARSERGPWRPPGTWQPSTGTFTSRTTLASTTGPRTRTRSDQTTQKMIILKIVMVAKKC